MDIEVRVQHVDKCALIRPGLLTVRHHRWPDDHVRVEEELRYSFGSGQQTQGSCYGRNKQSLSAISQAWDNAHLLMVQHCLAGILHL